MARQESLFWDESYAKETEAEAAKPKRPLKRRKKAKREVEDYYALLGVDAAADPAALKRAYIAKTKEFPPETHPEEFQKIRAAYETLRDPARRKEHDILLRYGETIEDLLREAIETPTINRNSINLLKRAVTIDPDHRGARHALAYAYFATGRLAEGCGQFYYMRRRAQPEELPALWRDLIKMLVQTRWEDEALAEAKRFLAAYPREACAAWDVLYDAYETLGEGDDLIVTIEKIISEQKPPAPDDIIMYVAWIHVADAVDWRDRVIRATKEARKFIKSFSTREDLSRIAAILRKESEKCYNDNDFDTAKILIDLALVADKSDTESKELSQRLVTISSLLREIELAQHDRKIFPPLVALAMRWLNEEYDFVDIDFNEIFGDMFDEMEERLQEFGEIGGFYAAGVKQLKKKYPALYKHFEQRWQDLVKEKTANLNRDERRSFYF